MPRLPIDRRRPFVRAIVIIIVVLAGAGEARAQDTVGDILSFLLTNRSVVTDDFARDAAATAATRDAITRALLLEVATLPISSSSGGFTYRFNPALGVTERASDSFGPIFVERALTAGRGRASFGASYRFNRFVELDGADLRDGTLVTTANRFSDESTPFDVETLSLRLETNTATFVGSVGVTDWLDVSAALPLVWVKLDGERVNTFRGRSTTQATASSRVTGLADLALRAKVRLAGRGGSGLALGTEVRVPTGQEEDLLGAGKASVKGQVIVSAEGGPVGFHLNGGYRAGGIADEIDGGAALTLAPAARLTFVAEVFGRRVNGLGRLTSIEQAHPTIVGVRTIRLASDGTDVTSGVGVFGMKWNLGSTWLLNASVALPLTDNGLKSRPVPSVSLDYAFGR